MNKKLQTTMIPLFGTRILCLGSTREESMILWLTNSNTSTVVQILSLNSLLTRFSTWITFWVMIMSSLRHLFKFKRRRLQCIRTCRLSIAMPVQELRGRDEEEVQQPKQAASTTWATRAESKRDKFTSSRDSLIRREQWMVHREKECSRREAWQRRNWRYNRPNPTHKEVRLSSS